MWHWSLTHCSNPRCRRLRQKRVVWDQNLRGPDQKRSIGSAYAGRDVEVLCEAPDVQREAPIRHQEAFHVLTAELPEEIATAGGSTPGPTEPARRTVKKRRYSVAAVVRRWGCAVRSAQTRYVSTYMRPRVPPVHCGGSQHRLA